MPPTRDQINAIARELVDSAVEVHRTLGAGLLERVYQLCLARELADRGLEVACEVQLPVLYKGRMVDAAYRVDMIIEDVVLVENECLPAILPVHEAQLLNHLRLSQRRIGFLINWNNILIRDGIRRLVMGLWPLASSRPWRPSRFSDT